MTKGMWLFILYLVVGLYLLNIPPLNFVSIPDSVHEVVDKWVILAGAVLLIFNSFRFLRRKSEQ